MDALHCTPIAASQTCLMFTLAHLSDVHLGPLPREAGLFSYLGKRAIGYCSWTFRRGRFHDAAIAGAMIADIRAHAPDHVALTGDLVNLALPAEFPRAARWLSDFGTPEWITFVPGNHDAYVQLGWNDGIGHLSGYMTGDMRFPALPGSGRLAAPMPFVRQRRNFALIGLSSAVPQNWRKAGGSLGAAQVAALAGILKTLRERGFCRIVMIHHPPLPGQNVARKALTDAAALRDVLASEGAELVLHGHNHTHMHARIGKTDVFGVPSASARGDGQRPPAAWNLYRIERKDSEWRITATCRTWNAAARAFEPYALELAGAGR